MQMGFRAQVSSNGIIGQIRDTDCIHQVDRFQPYYSFNPRFREDLKLAATILKDFLDLLSEKKARAEYAAKNAKAAQEEAATKVRLFDFYSFLTSYRLFNPGQASIYR